VGEGGWGDLECCYSEANALMCSSFTEGHLGEMGVSHVHQAVQVKNKKKEKKKGEKKLKRLIKI